MVTTARQLHRPQRSHESYAGGNIQLDADDHGYGNMSDADLNGADR